MSTTATALPAKVADNGDNEITKALRYTSIPDTKQRAIRLVTALMDPKTNPKDWIKIGCSELQDQFKTRLERTAWCPRAPEIHDMFVGALLAKPPAVHTEIEVEGSEETEKRARLLDQAGTTDWTEEAADSLVDYGLVAGALNQTIYAKQNEATKAMEQDAEDKAKTAASQHVTVFAAPTIYDWNFDDAGQMTMIKFCVRVDVRLAWNQAPAPVERFYIYELVQGRPMLKVFEIRDDGVWQTAEQEMVGYRVPGRLPVELRFAPSLIEKIMNLDLANIDAQSHRDWDIYVHQHPHAVLTSPAALYEQRKKTPLKFGSNDVIHLNGGDGTASMPGETFKLEYPTGDCIAEQDAVIEKRDRKIDQAVGIASADIQQAQSGVSIALKFRTAQQRLLSTYAKALESFENSLAELVGRAAVEYPREFAISPIDEANIHNAQQEALRGVPSAQRITKESYTWSVLDENKLSPEQIAEIEKDLEAWKPDTFDTAMGFGGGFAGPAEAAS